VKTAALTQLVSGVSTRANRWVRSVQLTWLSCLVQLASTTVDGRLDELREHARQSDADAKSRRLLALESRQRSLTNQLNRVENRQRWHVVLNLLDIL
jgi:ribosomal protein S15P/S13E